MIIVYDSMLGIEVELEGSVKETPKKINYSEITTIRGSVFSESSRGVINLSLTIDYITEEDYYRLTDIFLYGNNSLLIEDLDTGRTYKNYFIQGESLSLDRMVDYDSKTYYYKGGLNIFKR